MLRNQLQAQALKSPEELQELTRRESCELCPRVSSLQVALSELAEGLVEAGQEVGVGSIPFVFLMVEGVLWLQGSSLDGKSQKL